MKRRRAVVVLTLLALASGAAADHWPQFRGAAQGVSAGGGFPVSWKADANVAWRTALPGPGHSSPVIWGDRIFLTAFRPQLSLRRLWGQSVGQLLVLCLDRATGRILWEREVKAEAIEELHSTNAPASPTPATDGTLVYVHFGSKGLAAFDFNGRQVWEKPLGPFPNEWGSASSPILHGTLLLLSSDTDGEDFLLAVDKASGRTVWKTSRSEVNRAWPTPLVWNAAGTEEVVVSGSGQVKGYDLKTGRELWVVDGLTRWVSPTPVTAHGLLYVAANGPGGNVILAIRPGGRGNVTRTHLAWRYDRSAPYSSSPVVVGDHLYVVKNGGVMTCLDARTGAVAWQERLPAGGDYFASLVAAEGRVYALSQEGETTVVAAGQAYKVLASNPLGERTMATPALSRGQIFIRSDAGLFAIGTAR